MVAYTSIGSILTRVSCFNDVPLETLVCRVYGCMFRLTPSFPRVRACVSLSSLICCHLRSYRLSHHVRLFVPHLADKAPLPFRTTDFTFYVFISTDIIANIAGFMAYDVQSFPPGIHPPPSGRFALWERLIVDAVRTRAVTKIQLEWRKKMERAVARALAHVARLQM